MCHVQVQASSAKLGCSVMLILLEHYISYFPEFSVTLTLYSFHIKT